MGYDLEIELVDSDGSVAFRDRYYLQPGAAKSEVDAVPPGEYEIRAFVATAAGTTRPADATTITIR